MAGHKYQGSTLAILLTSYQLGQITAIFLKCEVVRLEEPLRQWF